MCLADPADAWPMFTSYFLAWLLIVPPGAYLADLLGRKTMLLAGSLALTLGMLLLSISTNLPMACAAQFLNGAGAILLQIVGVAIITDLDAQRRGSNLSLAVGLVGMVALLSPMLMTELLARGVEWTTVYRYSAILPALAFVAQWFCRFPTPAEPSRLRSQSWATCSAARRFCCSSSRCWSTASSSKGFRSGRPTISARNSARVFTGRELRWQGYRQRLLSDHVARAVDLGALGWLDGVSHPLVIVVCAVLGGICLALGTLSNHPTMAIIFLIASGPAIAMIWPSIMTYAVESTGQPTATVFGLVVGIGGATGVILGFERARRDQAGGAELPAIAADARSAFCAARADLHRRPSSRHERSRCAKRRRKASRSRRGIPGPLGSTDRGTENVHRRPVGRVGLRPDDADHQSRYGRAARDRAARHAGRRVAGGRRRSQGRSRLCAANRL